MAYDMEKYRAKREKVLGVRRRGVSFGQFAAGFAALIMVAMGFVVVPKSVAYFRERHLHDAIYRVQDETGIESAAMDRLLSLQGVNEIAPDHNGGRIVITFDMTEVDTARLNAFFKGEGINVHLLNTINHRQRVNMLEKEAEF